MTGVEIESLYASLGIDASGWQSGLREATAAIRQFTEVVEAQALRAEAAFERSRVEAQALRSAAAFGQAARAFEQAGSAMASAAIDAVSRSVQSFASYERTMSQIQGLAGETAEQVGVFSKEILGLGIAVGKAPQELASALYFLSSAGLNSAQAFKALEISAKASAAGLGETKVIADLLSSAMISYTSSSLSAERASDVLVAAVRYGKAEASSFATVIGKLLPLTSSLGVSFEDVAASMAAMTQSGVSAAEAATSVQAIMTALLKPTHDAQAALANVGLSVADLRAIIQGDGGIVEVLRLLQDRFKGNREAMADVFGNVRALRGVMNLLGQDAEKLDKIFLGVHGSAGDLSKAFGVAEKTLSFRFDQAIATVQALRIELGALIAPAVADILAVATAAGRWFMTWPAPLRATLAITVLITTAALALGAAILGVGVAIAAAAVAVTIATGGINVLLAALIGGAVALYAGIVSVVGVVLGLGVSVGYLSGAFAEVRAAALRTWEWLAPVRRALASLFNTITVLSAAAFDSITRQLSMLAQAAGGALQIDWDTILDGMVTAVLAAEYALLRLDATWDLMATGARYAVEVIKADFAHLWEKVLPAGLDWMIENVPTAVAWAFGLAKGAAEQAMAQMVASIGRIVGGLLSSLATGFAKIDWIAMWNGLRVAAWEVAKSAIKSIVDVLADLPAIVADPKKFFQLWKKPDALEIRAPQIKVDAAEADREHVANAALEAQRQVELARRGLELTPFVMPLRREGDEERVIREEWERKKDAWLIGFAEFKRLRQQEFIYQQQLDEALAERKRIEDVVQPTAPKKEHLKDDFVAFDSAEAAHRVWAHRERLAKQDREMSLAAEAAAKRESFLENEAALHLKILALRQKINEATGNAPRPTPPQPLSPNIILPGPREQAARMADELEQLRAQESAGESFLGRVMDAIRASRLADLENRIRELDPSRLPRQQAPFTPPNVNTPLLEPEQAPELPDFRSWWQPQMPPMPEIREPSWWSRGLPEVQRPPLPAPVTPPAPAPSWWNPQAANLDSLRPPAPQAPELSRGPWSFPPPEAFGQRQELSRLPAPEVPGPWQFPPPEAFQQGQEVSSLMRPALEEVERFRRAVDEQVARLSPEDRARLDRPEVDRTGPDGQQRDRTVPVSAELGGRDVELRPQRVNFETNDGGRDRNLELENQTLLRLILNELRLLNRRPPLATEPANLSEPS